jgi:hypothetical protein
LCWCLPVCHLPEPTPGILGNVPVALPTAVFQWERGRCRSQSKI